MKKSVAVFLFIFWIIVVVLSIAGLILHNLNQGVSATMVASSTSANNSKVTSPMIATSTPVNNKVTLTVSEVAKHNHAGDCWSIINGKVYNLTSLVNTHSGGSSAILQSCGVDGSVSFNTRDGRGSHSSSAQNILDTFLVGSLGGSI